MKTKRNWNNRTWFSMPYIIWIIGFTVIPLIVIFQDAFRTSKGTLTMENILAIFHPIHLKSLIFSIEIAIGCTMICILISYPLVLALKRLKLRKQGFLIFVLILPMWMNFILRLLAWQMILSKNGILNMILGFIGVGTLPIANTWISILIGVVYDYLPFMILPIYNAITELDDDIIEAAKDLGASDFTVFQKVILPLSFPGLLSGIVMVFVPSMTSFVVADVLGGGKIQLIGNVIEQEFTKNVDWSLGSGLSVSLMIFVMISMAFTMKNDPEGKESAIW